MKRAYLMEMTVFRDYAKQLLGIGFFVVIFVSGGMGTIVAAPAILTMMFFLMGTMAAAAYDEQNGWGLFRLTMPVSRRDVVLGRYGVIVTLGLFGLVAGLAAGAVLVGLAQVMPLPFGLSDALALSTEDVLATFFAAAFCLMLGAVITSIETPVYFRLGQNKTTQWLPMITVLVFVGPMLIINGTGILDDGAINLAAIGELLGFIESPVGVAVFFAAAVVVAAVALSISAAVSLKLYDRREL